MATLLYSTSERIFITPLHQCHYCCKALCGPDSLLGYKTNEYFVFQILHFLPLAPGHLRRNWSTSAQL